MASCSTVNIDSQLRNNKVHLLPNDCLLDVDQTLHSGLLFISHGVQKESGQILFVGLEANLKIQTNHSLPLAVTVDQTLFCPLRLKSSVQSAQKSSKSFLGSAGWQYSRMTMYKALICGHIWVPAASVSTVDHS